jgi:hypothetical protein
MCQRGAGAVSAFRIHVHIQASSAQHSNTKSQSPNDMRVPCNRVIYILGIMKTIGQPSMLLSRVLHTTNSPSVVIIPHNVIRACAVPWPGLAWRRSAHRTRTIW